MEIDDEMEGNDDRIMISDEISDDGHNDEEIMNEDLQEEEEKIAPRKNPFTKVSAHVSSSSSTSIESAKAGR
jgi:hypothetical protein